MTKRKKSKLYLIERATTGVACSPPTEDTTTRVRQVAIPIRVRGGRGRLARSRDTAIAIAEVGNALPCEVSKTLSTRVKSVGEVVGSARASSRVRPMDSAESGISSCQHESIANMTVVEPRRHKTSIRHDQKK